MADISRVALFGKLNSLCYGAIEAATVFWNALVGCVSGFA